MREIIRLIAFAFLVTGCGTFTYTFLKAYFSKEKAITIYINNKGEAKLEFVLVILSFISYALAIISFS